MPKPEFKTSGTPDSRSQILLSAANATKFAGGVRPITDTNTVSGKAIEIGGTQEIVVYPPHTDAGRKTRTTSEFNLKLNPNNFGAMLRRKLDYSFPNQRAEVFVADAGKTEITDAD